MRKNKTQPPLVRLIENDGFPFEFVSVLAERESWRKEIYRPIYHLHKWWAKRLGSVFRGILLGCMLDETKDLAEEFYRVHDFTGKTVFDPFMGSGTTIGEAHKLGFAALGRDINPVACESVRVAFGPINRGAVVQAFHELAQTAGRRIRELYRTMDEEENPGEVLYYFWVKNLPCPHCGEPVDLLSSRIFASNAYPNRKPEVQVLCPDCGAVFRTVNNRVSLRCPECSAKFDPHLGLAKGASATCSTCRKAFLIKDAAGLSNRPPRHRLYAKLVLTQGNEKKYCRATPADIKAYEDASRVLKDEESRGLIKLPDACLADGFNTRQAIGYNYRNWRDFFNDRQLLALGWLQRAITRIGDETTRDALLILFSGVLEFNNCFASYKGEGTGAVRHMFAHHILKPERTPIEANVWGTPKSSGSFSNLFQARMARLLDYRDSPFEVAVDETGKKFTASPAFRGSIDPWPSELIPQQRTIHLSCGSSDETGLPANSVDLVVTDPPFFDNVHYSELADFFYSWQSLYPRGFIGTQESTRHPREVQDTDALAFSSKLEAVFRECSRVLRRDGLMVFSYHHSRAEGWASLAHAVLESGFSIVNAHPVKAEMSVAAPKAQAKEPIQIDMIIVCRKAADDTRARSTSQKAISEAIFRAREKAHRIVSKGFTLSLNDRRVIITGQYLASLCPQRSSEELMHLLVENRDALEAAALELPSEPDIDQKAESIFEPRQKSLPF